MGPSWGRNGSVWVLTSRETWVTGAARLVGRGKHAAEGGKGQSWGGQSGRTPALNLWPLWCCPGHLLAPAGVERAAVLVQQ